MLSRKRKKPKKSKKLHTYDKNPKKVTKTFIKTWIHFAQDSRTPKKLKKPRKKVKIVQHVILFVMLEIRNKVVL